MTQKTQQNKVIIGCLGSAFGVRGELKVTSYTVPISNILSYPTWHIERNGNWQPLAIEKVRMQGANIILKIKHVDDRDIAKTYTNALISIERSELPETATNEYYWTDLIGMSVTTVDGTLLGHITEMRDTGANDVMIIQNDKKRHLVPFIDQVVQSVDRNEQSIIVDWDDDF